LITIKNLAKRYENLTFVDNLNLTIDENEVFGLLGPNGAGKTTTIHMLATLLIPTPNDVFLQLTGRHVAKEEHSEGGFMERYAQYGK
jgi:ABC-type multidrug transport system ATPase subunit